MRTVLQFVLPEIEEPMMIMNNPPLIPNVGDLTVGPDGHVFQIVQRAFLINDGPKLTIAGANNSGNITIQCVIIPVEKAPLDENLN